MLLIYAVLWFIFDRTTLDWHGFATLAAVFMTLIIQRAENRDTQALQAKLYELLHASRSVDSERAKIDSLEKPTPSVGVSSAARRTPTAA